MSNKEIVYWKQKDGKLVSIDDMDTNHLKNVLKMIVKNSNKHKVQKEFKLNGDMANEFNDLPESMDIGNNELGHY
jgi:hypothetical protein